MDEKNVQNFSLWKEAIKWTQSHLNWLDLITFLLGVFILLGAALFVFRKRRRQHEQELTELAIRYEEALNQIKESQLHEIHIAEEKVKEFRVKLAIVEEDYERSVARLERKYHKRHEEEISHRDMTLFDLQRGIARLRKKQLGQVETYEQEVQRLKREISGLHENHSKEIELAEMEISNLRKQINALIDKV